MSLKSIIILLLVVSAAMFFLIERVMRSGAESPEISAAAQPAQQVSAEPQLIADINEVPAVVDGPGRDVFVINCTTCHSLRYVLMQPKFSRKVWTAEVTKMVNAYKAALDSAQQAQIIDYLVSAYGVPDKT
jgi:cytochrome c5